MAATAWSLYNTAKKYIGNGTINLASASFKMKLTTSASNASTFTISTFASITSEIGTSGGYATGGKALTSVTWTVGSSAKQYRLDCADPLWTATGGPLTNIKYGVIGVSGGKALCWSRFSTSPFSVSIGGTFTTQIAATGIFNIA